MSNSRNRTALGIILAVAVLFAILLIFASNTMNQIEFTSDKAIRSGNKDLIAVVEVAGVILSSKKTIEKLHLAEEDDDYKGIILRVNSPGGAVGPTQEIYHEIIRINKTKKIYASFGAVAASGGYYIGAAADQIYSNAGSMTGSIGVIMQFNDMSELFKMAKMTPYNIKAGKYKDIGSTNRQMTAEELAMMNSMIKGVHQQFIDDIYAPRHDRLTKKNLELYAQGQIFSGAQAKELGLVDKLGGIWVAARELHQNLGLKNKLALEYVKTKKEKSVWRFFDKLDEVSSLVDEFKAQSVTTPMFLYKR
ncbi:MAG: signal peptide peptidase SppA [Bacteriovoracaceae bacterium]|nr:signal peptide peptidase SppA [Bacteriovoracaceae bacterium]